MRILHVNKYLYRRGGAEAYMQDLAGLQRAAGHQVELFGMQHPENDPARYSAHFPPYLELEPPPPALAGGVRAFGRMLWSPSAARGLDAVAADFRPDIVHLHNIYHHLSPSVLRPLARRRVPAVMTLHDYKLACPTYRFLDQGRVCEACLGGRFHQAALRRCKDGSLTASAAAAAELSLHTLTRAYRGVSRFVCPSRFLQAKMTEAGVYPERLRWVPNFVDTASVAASDSPGLGVVFAGRLSAEKGVDVLIDAVAALDPEVTLTVVGEGPQGDDLRRRADQRAPARVRFTGRLDRSRVLEVLRAAAVVAVPSLWYENQPVIVLEALACGVPVAASAIGGLPELVRPGVDGELVPPGDPSALAAALARLLADPAERLARGRAGRARVEEEHSPAHHLARLHEVYAEAGARVGN